MGMMMTTLGATIQNEALTTIEATSQWYMTNTTHIPTIYQPSSKKRIPTISMDVNGKISPATKGYQLHDGFSAF